MDDHAAVPENPLERPTPKRSSVDVLNPLEPVPSNEISPAPSVSESMSETFVRMDNTPVHGQQDSLDSTASLRAAPHIRSRPRISEPVGAQNRPLPRLDWRGTASRIAVPTVLLGAHKRYGLGFITFFLVLMLLTAFSINEAIGFIFLMCFGVAGVGITLICWMLSLPQGNRDMTAVAVLIREGCEAYMHTLLETLAQILVSVSAVIFMLSWFRYSFLSSLMMTLSLGVGGLSTAIVSVANLWTSTRANACVAQAACTGSAYNTITVGLRAGAIAGLCSVGPAVFGIALLITISASCVIRDINRVPDILVSYGSGAAIVALFIQLAGGIYMKAADVGADLSGKVDLELPEDDLRNPAVIADLIGDNVGDCCTQGADIFMSLAVDVVAAMIIGADVARTTGASPGYVVFPLFVLASDLIVSTVVLISLDSSRTRNAEEAAAYAEREPIVILKMGYVRSLCFNGVFLWFSAGSMLDTLGSPKAWWHFLLCAYVGQLAAFLVILIVQYYTDLHYLPVQEISQASEYGHGANLILGLGVGFESTFPPIALICVAIFISYHLGQSAGLTAVASGDGSGLGQEAIAIKTGFFGIAMALMGMLSNITYVHAMSMICPMADNAAGIVGMTPDCPEFAKQTLSDLSSMGNTVKAFTKGFSLCSAGLASLLLFQAFLKLAGEQNGKDISIDTLQPEHFICGILGGATVFTFTALAMRAVGSSLQLVVTEVRRQFREVAGISTYEARPDYGSCVAILTEAAVRLMVKPGVLAILMPIGIGIIFSLCGRVSDDPLLGAKAMVAYLVCSSMVVILLALFLSTSGSAWHNAKKYIESGAHGGKEGTAYKAAVTGDVVGDPAKDTAAPSLLVLMKLTATLTTLVGPVLTVPCEVKVS